MTNRKEPDLAQLYHLNSSNVRCRRMDPELDWDKHPLRFRSYPGAARVPLPGKDFALDASLGALLAGRRSVRAFTPAPLPLESLGRLLFTSYGIRGITQFGEDGFHDRPAPSAGALYPLELYVATQDVAGLDDGVYHYDALGHQLERRRAGCFQSELAGMTLGQEMIASTNVVVFICGVFERTQWKYGQRGYRYVWMEAGHVAQNLYLVADALGLGATAIGGFFDAEVNCLLGLPTDEEASLYLLCIGHTEPSGT